MNKNLIVFVLVSVGIYSAWMWYLKKKYPDMGKSVPAHVSEGRAEAGKDTAKGTAVSSAPASGSAAPSKAKIASTKKEQRVQVSTSGVHAELSSKGARLLSWKLPDYREDQKKTEAVQLIDPLLEEPMFGALQIDGSNLETAAWNLETSSPLKNADGSQSVVFSTAMGNSPVFVRKTYSFDPQATLVNVKLEFANNGRQDLKLGNGFLLWGPNVGIYKEGRQEAMSEGGAVQRPGKIEREGHGDPKVFSYTDPVWVAVKNHYFMAAWLNDAGFPQAELRRMNLGGDHKGLTAALGLGELLLKAGEKKAYQVRLYAGPQNYETLKSFGNNLQAVVQFTFQWLSPLSVLLLRVMKALEAITRNWGVAIMLLTLLVKLLLFWPTHKGMVSSRRMQTRMAKMQPVLESIKRTYKDNPAKLNEETMKVYKEHGVNPLGGCFLMLPQMFIMIALYGALNGAFELRGAGFWGPWTDLSAADPTYVLVPLMGLSMFIQQKMAPPSATMSEDQVQMQKMMLWMMPIMFTVMGFIFKWPTGLLLYWSVSNVFGIGQQWYVNKTVK